MSGSHGFRRTTRGTFHQESGLLRSEWNKLRDKVLQRDQYTCLRCKARIRVKKDTVIRALLPGSNELSNLITLCYPCAEVVDAESLTTVKQIESNHVGGKVNVITRQQQEQAGDGEAFRRPHWHGWVYGGQKNPKV